jgi:hypothetical protein
MLEGEKEREGKYKERKNRREEEKQREREREREERVYPSSSTYHVPRRPDTTQRQHQLHRMNRDSRPG